MSGTSEVGRQATHIAVGGFAVLLRWLSSWQAAGLAMLAIAVNRWALPRIAPAVFRDGDRQHPWRSGIVLYPIAVLGLVVAFPGRPDIVAGSWAVLAAGDGAATLVGRRWPIAALPWNRDKSAGGLAAFVVAGGVAAVTAIAWVGPNAPPLAAGWAIAAVAAALVAGLVESAPIRFNDNVSVPAVAALALWSLGAFDAGAAGRWWSTGGATLLSTGLAANAAVAIAGYMARTVTASGALAGAVIGTTVFAGFGGPGWALLLAAFLLAALATRAGEARKARAGLGEPRGGRRGPGNAIANTGLAAWCALVAVGARDDTAAALAFAATLVATSSDTVASEIGKAFGRGTWSVWPPGRVAPGTSGAVSAAGTAAGIAGAAILSSVAAFAGLVAWTWVGALTAAATVAGLVEGLLASRYEASGVFDNNALNFVNGGVAAALVLATWRVVG